MPIKKPLGDLPPPPGSPEKPVGQRPDARVRFAGLLAEKWHAENMAAGERPHAIPGTRFRHSDAGGCARKIAYKAAGLAATNPMDVTGSWNTRLGTLIHDEWQEALQEEWAHANIEVTSQFLPDGSGSMDALVETEDGKVISIELKTVGGYAFKDAIGKQRRGQAPSGPKREHIIQGALNAAAHNADELVISYLAKETLSKSYDDVVDVDKLCADWTFTREQYEPVARLEAERIEGILSLLDEGTLASRKIPGVPGEIVDPMTGRYERRVMDVTDNTETYVADTGTHWACQYCSHQQLCSLTDSGRIAVSSMDVAITTLGLTARPEPLDGPVRGDG